MPASKETDALKTDPEKLILTIKKYPEVWNTHCPAYKVKKSKERAWDKIATEVVEDWKCFSRKERHTTLRALIKRWNNIRDYYVKSLKARRRKKYALASQLEFLYPELARKMHFQVTMKQTEGFKIEAADDEVAAEEPEMIVEKLEQSDEEDIQEDYVTFVDTFDHTYEGSNHSKRQETLMYDDLPERGEDPDLMFLKSLLPDMKKLADDEKFEFKYAIMQSYMNILKKRKL